MQPSPPEYSHSFHKLRSFLSSTEDSEIRATSSVVGTAYIGEYANDKRDGKGKLILMNQSTYEGDFKNGLFHGQGVLKSNKFIYKGQFVNGKREGFGHNEDLIKHVIYDGEYKDDYCEGKGIEKYSDGSMYKGKFKKGMKNGKGTLIIKNDITKEKNDKEIIINENNNNNSNEKYLIYKGEFKDNKIWGKGKFILEKGYEYYGDWVNNEMNGFGIMCSGMLIYAGNFYKDKKNGYGSIFFKKNSCILLGKWENDLIEGNGIVFPIDIGTDFISRKNERKIRFVFCCKGSISKIISNENEIKIIKDGQQYKDVIELYEKRIYCIYLKEVYSGILS